MARNDGDRVENKLEGGVADAREKLLAEAIAWLERAHWDARVHPHIVALLAAARSHQSEVPRPLPLPDRDGQWIGEAFATDKQLVIAISTGYELDEDHNCDAMGCGQWHVLFRIPKAALASPVEGDRKDAEIVAAARHFIEIDRYSSVAAYKAQNGRFGHSPWAELAAAIDAAKDHQNG